MSEAYQPEYKVTFDAAGAERMRRIAREVFAPIYPVLAGQIVDRLGVATGWGLDIGAGPGSLGLALVEQTDLNMILLDSSEPMIREARNSLAATGYGGRCLVMPGDVHSLPLADKTVQVIVSRGSIFFWENLEQAFKEIIRVLAPSGKTYLGGGFGTADLRDRIGREMAERDPGWKAFRERNLGKRNKDRILTALNQVTADYELFDDDSGFWIAIAKEPA